MRRCPECLKWYNNDQARCPVCSIELEKNEYSSEDADDGIFSSGHYDVPREATRCFMGIDIGRNGGTSVLLDGSSVELKMPTIIVKKTNKKKINIPALVDRLFHAAEECSKYNLELHYIYEKTSSMPHEGVTSAFAFGYSSGGIAYTLRAIERLYPDIVRIHETAPAVWKRHFGLVDSEASKYQKKLASVKYANKNLNKKFKNTDDGLADAMLMAHYAQYIVEEMENIETD